jgi:Uma2 family endonuclease
MVVHMERRGVQDVEIDPRFPRGILRADWHRIAEEIAPNENRIELVRGLAVRMSPLSRAHRDVHSWLVTALVRQLDDAYAVRGQGSLPAGDDSEPQPDILVLPADWPPEEPPSDALLVIEVSVSSLRYDRGTKLELYAEAGVREYWIVDVNARVVEIYTEPDPAAARYREVRVCRDGDILRPTLLPTVAIEVAKLPR